VIAEIVGVAALAGAAKTIKNSNDTSRNPHLGADRLPVGS
jgi:hypothetical protein